MLETVVSDQYRNAHFGLIAYHTDLEREVCAGRINESFLKHRLDELEERWPFRDVLYWLSVARINELALYCAGNYADSLEFSAAGDLLVNPRLILVYTRNQVVPFKKDRHVPLTVQFAAEEAADPEVRRWLRDNAVVHVKEKPLLHHLYEQLKSSGCIAQHYLFSAENRMKRIAQTIGFLAAWKVSDRCELIRRLASISKEERSFITENLCRFSTELFDELGHEIYRVMGDRHYKSKFFCLL